MRGYAQSGNSLAFGEFGLKGLECGWISARQIEAARVALSRYTKRAGRVWLRLFPDKPITSRPAGTRMGGGKGDIQEYVAVVKPGKILFELAGVSIADAQQAMERASAKLPIKCKFVSR